MTVGVIGVGAIGKALAGNLVQGGQLVSLASRDQAHAQAVAAELGENARAGSLSEVIGGSDIVVLAVPFTEIASLIGGHQAELEDTVVVDPTNAVARTADGSLKPLLAAGRTAGAAVAAALPRSASYAKAFGTMGAESLRDNARHQPLPFALFVAGDDDAVSATARLIRSAGYEPVVAGDRSQVARLETGGDLHQYGGLQGRLVDGAEGRRRAGSA